MNKVDLKDLVGGALQEKFSKSFEKVVDNLQDKNTSFKVKRTITIKLTFEQNEARDDFSLSIDVHEKLAPQVGIKTSFYMGKDLQTGEIFVEEYGKQIKGQMSLEDYKGQAPAVQVIDGDMVNTETGKILHQSEKVIDLRKAAL